MIIKLQREYSQDKEVKEDNTLRNALIGTTIAGAGTGITGHLHLLDLMQDIGLCDI